MAAQDGLSRLCFRLRHTCHTLRTIVEGFGPRFLPFSSFKINQSHSLMTVLPKNDEKGGEAGGLIAGSHVDRLQLQ
jgi:hypothetical protein